MKKFLLSFLSLCLLLTLVGCSQKPNPEDTIKGYYEALKSGDLAKAASYCVLKEEYVQEVKDNIAILEKMDSKPYEKFAKDVYSNLEYKIISVEKDSDNTVTATIEVTMMDEYKAISQYYSDYMTWEMNAIFEGREEPLSLDEVFGMFFKAIDDHKAEVTTDTVTVMLLENGDSYMMLRELDIMAAELIALTSKYGK